MDNQPISEAELKLIRDQIDQLQIVVHEPRKPWYRQRPSLISLLALLFSIVSFGYSQYHSTQAEIRSKQEELRKLLSDLAQIQSETQSLAEVQDGRKREMQSSILNSKRVVLIEAAEALVDGIPKFVSSAAYGVLASEKVASSDFKQAERYYESAATVARGPLARATAYRSLGMLYFTRSPLLDYSKGRRAFQQAVDSMTGSSDEYSQYTIGYIYEWWGFCEGRSNFRQEAEKNFAMARKYYDDLSKDNPLRAWALEALQGRMAMALNPEASPMIPALPAAGKPLPPMQ